MCCYERNIFIITLPPSSSCTGKKKRPDTSNNYTVSSDKRNERYYLPVQPVHRSHGTATNTSFWYKSSGKPRGNKLSQARSDACQNGHAQCVHSRTQYAEMHFAPTFLGYSHLAYCCTAFVRPSVWAAMSTKAEHASHSLRDWWRKKWQHEVSLEIPDLSQLRCQSQRLVCLRSADLAGHATCDPLRYALSGFEVAVNED